MEAGNNKLYGSFFSNRALVFICHGFGEHCSRYERLGSALADQGYLAFSHDHGMINPSPKSWNLTNPNTP